MFVRRVLIADEQELFRCGIAQALESLPHLRIVGQVGTAHEAVMICRDHRPHLAILSASLPGITGLALAKELARFWPDLMIGMVGDDATCRETRQSCVNGTNLFLRRDATEIEFQRAVMRILAVNPKNLAKEQTSGVVQPSLAEPQSPPLSGKELEILDCVAQGFSNKEIGRELHLTEQTVKNHLTSIYRKLGVNDRVQAVLRSAQLGWIDLSPPVHGHGLVS